MQARREASLFLAILAGAATAGCLPRGEPPQGQQLLAGRGHRVILFQSGATASPPDC